MASAAITDQVACSLCNDFYTDARTLQCQHSFCLECVRSRYLSDSRQCPNCSRETIPNSIDEVESLVPSINLNQQVGLLIRQGACPWGDNTKEKMRKREEAQFLKPKCDIHHAICNECRSQVAGFRYRCGMCPDYDLCQNCFDKSGPSIHSDKHILLKLKRPENIRRYTLSPVVDHRAIEMVQTFNYASTTHVSEDTTKRPIKCDHCGVQPIEGLRFKCGYCEDYNLCTECEKESEEIHDKNHVFLILPHPCIDSTSPRLLTHQLLQ